jgi:hypothetical protein
LLFIMAGLVRLWERILRPGGLTLAEPRRLHHVGKAAADRLRIAQRLAAIVVRDGIAGADRQKPVQRHQRVLVAVQALQGFSAALQQGNIARFDGERAVETRQRFFKTRQPHLHQGAVGQNAGIGGLEIQRPVEGRQRFGKASHAHQHIAVIEQHLRHMGRYQQRRADQDQCLLWASLLGAHDAQGIARLSIARLGVEDCDVATLRFGQSPGTVSRRRLPIERIHTHGAL